MCKSNIFGKRQETSDSFSSDEYLNWIKLKLNLLNNFYQQNWRWHTEFGDNWNLMGRFWEYFIRFQFNLRKINQDFFKPEQFSIKMSGDLNEERKLSIWLLWRFRFEINSTIFDMKCSCSQFDNKYINSLVIGRLRHF